MIKTLKQTRKEILKSISELSKLLLINKNDNFIELISIHYEYNAIINNIIKNEKEYTKEEIEDVNSNAIDLISRSKRIIENEK